MRMSRHLRVSGVGGGIALGNQNMLASNPVHRESGRRFWRTDRSVACSLARHGFEFGRCDVPVRPAFPGDGMEVLAEILQNGLAEGPVDVLDDNTGLENNHVDGVR